ncbi:MAG: ion channel [Bacteroidota bacterium]
MSTVGYGDIVPGTPIARSLATFISISGQLYIAIIIALLVGKFSGRQKYSGINQQSTNE